jgi:hypothetical protein
VVSHEDRCVALGREDRQGRFDDVMLLVGDQLVQGSIFRLLAEHGAALFGDEYFADLFKRSTLGRPTVPARVVATVMLLQAYEGLSDREACDRLAFDLRWKAAAGLTVEAGAFHPTVLVGMRNRLRASDRPRRLFDDVNTTARTAGLLRGRRRVIDSTPLFDAVAPRPRAFVQAARSGQDRHSDPKRAERWRPLRMVTVCCAGQVTVPAARSMRNWSLEKPLALRTGGTLVRMSWPRWVCSCRVAPSA